jgi:hypothetical protein
MATAPVQTKDPLPLSEEQNRKVRRLAQSMLLAAGVVLLLALVQVAGGIWTIWQGNGWGAGLWWIIQGGITGVSGLVLLTAAGDFGFMADVPQVRAAHLQNGLNSLRVFYQIQIALAALIGFVVVIRLLIG